MDIKDHKRHENTKHIIDFGTIDDAEYDILCARAFGYQGLASKWNHVYDEVSNKRGQRLFKRTRIAAAFEFPSAMLIDIWLKEELPFYFPEEIPEEPKKIRRKSVTPVKTTAAI
jgi:hypothetical protein